ncbi:MAG: YbaN family protein [Anaerolineaceae bacterium]|nr:YbaN family protein [Anaerolineaceae bacterium]
MFSSVKNTILILLGTLFVGLGLVGVFVPLLPTTPFLLLAAAAYAHSSERFYHWLLNNRLFGKYIRDYREHRGVSALHRAIALTFLWLTMGYAAFFRVEAWWVKVILLIVAAGVTIHLARLKTIRPQDSEKLRKRS